MWPLWIVLGLCALFWLTLDIILIKDWIGKSQVVSASPGSPHRGFALISLFLTILTLSTLSLSICTGSFLEDTDQRWVKIISLAGCSGNFAAMILGGYVVFCRYGLIESDLKPLIYYASSGVDGKTSVAPARRIFFKNKYVVGVGLT